MKYIYVGKGIGGKLNTGGGQSRNQWVPEVLSISSFALSYECVSLAFFRRRPILHSRQVAVAPTHLEARNEENFPTLRQNLTLFQSSSTSNYENASVKLENKNAILITINLGIFLASFTRRRSTDGDTKPRPFALPTTGGTH